jgi:hypothetical protein
LLDLAPQRATRVLPDGREDTVDTESLAVGDVILVRPGGQVGADGWRLAAPVSSTRPFRVRKRWLGAVRSRLIG